MRFNLLLFFFLWFYSVSISLEICTAANRVDFDGQRTLKNIYIRNIARDRTVFARW